MSEKVETERVKNAESFQKVQVDIQRTRISLSRGADMSAVLRAGKTEEAGACSQILQELA